MKNTSKAEQQEEWRPVVGYEGLYEISNFGRLRSMWHQKTNKPRVLYMKSTNNGSGYQTAVIVKNRVRKTKSIHQLVAEAFLGHNPCKMLLVINHINNVKSDNRLENLEIVTNRYNSSCHRKNKSSKFTGVCWRKKDERWISEIQINGERKVLGYFINEIDAHNAYQNKLKEIHSTP